MRSRIEENGELSRHNSPCPASSTMLDLHANTAPQPNAHDDNNDNNPYLGSELHRVCSKIRVRLEDIQGLLAQHKNATLLLQTRDPLDKWLPIHRLCRRQPSLAVIQYVVESMGPDSVRQWTDDAALPARLPIHLACQYGASLSVVQYLARVDPTTLIVQTTYRHFTALDYAHDYYRRVKTTTTSGAAAAAGNVKKETTLSVHDDAVHNNDVNDDHHAALEVIEWLVKQQSPSVSSSSSSSCTTDNKPPSFNSTLTMSTVATDDSSERDEEQGPEEPSSPKVPWSERKQPEQPKPAPKNKNSRPPPPKKMLLSLALSLRANKDKKQKQKQEQALQVAMQQLQEACWEEPPYLAKISKLVEACPQAVREAKTVHGDYTLLHQICWNAAGSIAAASITSSQVQEQEPLQDGSSSSCCNNDILKIMTCLMQAWPESVQQTTSAGYLPLHLLLSGCSAKRAVESRSRATSFRGDGGGSNGTTAATRIESCSTSTRRSDDASSTSEKNVHTILVQLVNFLTRQYPAGLVKPATVDGFLPLHCAIYCGAPLSVVQALVEALPETLHMNANKNIAVVVPVKKESSSSIVDTADSLHEEVDAEKGNGPSTITNTMSPLALAQQSIMGEMTKRPDVIAWLTTRLHEHKEQQQPQEQERQQRQQAAIAAVTSEQRAQTRQQEENGQQQQQQQQLDSLSSDVPAEEAISCRSLPDIVASHPSPTNSTTLLHPSEPEPAAVSQVEQHQQQDTPAVVHPLSLSATDPTANSTEAPLRATDEPTPTSNTLEPDALQQDQHQRARFTFLFHRSREKAHFIR